MLAPACLLAAVAVPPPDSPACRYPEPKESTRPPGVAFDELSRQAGEAWEAGRRDDAVRLYRAGLELNPLWTDGRWRLALVLSENACEAQARDALRELVRQAPESNQGWALLGVTEYRLGAYERAFASLSRASGLGLPTGELGVQAMRALTLLLIRDGRFAATSKQLQQLARLQPEDPEVVMACGLMALRLPKLPVEVGLSEQDLVRTAGRAACAAFAGRTAESRKAFDELLARYPRTRGVHLAYGLVLSHEASGEATAMLRKEVSLFPDNAEAQTELAFELLDRANPGEAAAPARAAVRLTPGSFWSHLALGRALLAGDAVEDAVRELEEAARLAPGVRDVYVALAQGYRRAGRTEDLERARQVLQQIDARRGAGRE